MSLGLPAIGGKFSGGVPWVIGNGNLCYDLSSADNLSKKIQEIMSCDYARLGMTCFQEAKSRFSLENVSKRYLNFYEDVICHKSISKTSKLY